MGKLVWHQYARLVSLTASVYAVWACFWGFIFRKFFWDFVHGTLRDPGGIQSPPNDAVFEAVIVEAPVVQIVALFFGTFMIALEYPVLQFKKLSIYRSIALRVVLLVFQAFFNVLLYQGTNAALWSMISVVCYLRALALGEKMKRDDEQGNNWDNRA